jgi:hypothetical protein
VVAASQYKEDKAKYDEEHPELSTKPGKKRKGDDGEKGDGKSKKAKKEKRDPNAPKRGQNAFSETPYPPGPSLALLARSRACCARGG